MKKAILALFCASFALIGCTSDAPVENSVNEPQQQQLANRQSRAQVQIDNVLKSFTTKDYQSATSNLSKEEVQMDMAMKLLPECKKLLVEKGYTEEDFETKFNNDYKQIILTAFTLKN